MKFAFFVLGWFLHDSFVILTNPFRRVWEFVSFYSQCVFALAYLWYRDIKSKWERQQ